MTAEAHAVTGHSPAHPFRTISMLGSAASARLLRPSTARTDLDIPGTARTGARASGRGRCGRVRLRVDQARLDVPAEA